MCQTLHPSPPTPPASHNDEPARQEQTEQTAVGHIVRTGAGSRAGMQAGASCWPGQRFWGSPRKGPRKDTVNPEESPQILPQGLLVPRGSAALSLGKRGTHPHPGPLGESGQHCRVVVTAQTGSSEGTQDGANLWLWSKMTGTKAMQPCRSTRDGYSQALAVKLSVTSGSLH